MAERELSGIGVSAGVRIGRAFVYTPVRMTHVEKKKTADAAAELTRLQTAKANCESELQALIERTQPSLARARPSS